MLLLRGLPGRWAGVVVSCCVLAGCASNAPTPRGEVKGAPTHAAEMAQSDANRMATLAMQENLEGLLRLADKLYRRNPAEWRKGTATSREQALEQLRAAVFKTRRQGTLDAMKAVLRTRGDKQRQALFELVGKAEAAQLNLPWIAQGKNWTTPILDVVELLDFVDGAADADGDLRDSAESQSQNGAPNGAEHQAQA